ncbi:hypothetical protein EYF80_064061 [Liparis tanakae]|uniref:Uncharacterized protein n=1 Tax=Liparis tanakae TaxID=230148 RepID=A0A4Z2EAA2_9TELE|nr:hypothetical protein EYF80_064061 [Liparis tanakae]
MTEAQPLIIKLSSSSTLALSSSASSFLAPPLRAPRASSSRGASTGSEVHTTDRMVSRCSPRAGTCSRPLTWLDATTTGSTRPPSTATRPEASSTSRSSSVSTLLENALPKAGLSRSSAAGRSAGLLTRILCRNTLGLLRCARNSSRMVTQSRASCAPPAAAQRTASTAPLRNHSRVACASTRGPSRRSATRGEKSVRWTGAEPACGDDATHSLLESMSRRMCPLPDTNGLSGCSCGRLPPVHLRQEAAPRGAAGRHGAAEPAAAALGSQVPVEDEEEQQADEEPPRPAARQQAREPLEPLLEPHARYLSRTTTGGERLLAASPRRVLPLLPACCPPAAYLLPACCLPAARLLPTCCPPSSRAPQVNSSSVETRRACETSGWSQLP